MCEKTNTSAAVAVTVTVLGLCAAALAAQGTAPRAFDVVSVKPNTSGDFRRAIGPGPGGRF